MNPHYVVWLDSILRKHRPRVRLDRKRIRDAASDTEVYDILVEAFGKDAVREASMATAIHILLEAYGLEAVEKAEQKLAKIKQAVEDKKSEILAARAAKPRPAKRVRAFLNQCRLPKASRGRNG